MAEQTGIEWTDHTFNPWWGCEKVSPGCAHCYAEGVSARYEGPGLWGANHRFRFFGDGHWDEPLKWDRKAEKEGRRHRVFCASMADVFEERAELEPHRERLLALIDVTPWLDWQILTKRPEYARDWLRDELRYRPNVWLGVSIENSRHAWRADVLRSIPAAVRFISAEPLLGSLSGLDLDGIDWVIGGGESGPAARAMRPDWAREIRDACAGAGVAFLFKQWGAHDAAGAKVGKKAAGRVLDGRTWDEFPLSVAGAAA